VQNIVALDVNTQLFDVKFDTDYVKNMYCGYGNQLCW